MSSLSQSQRDETPDTATLVDRNLALTEELVLRLLDDPDLLEALPDESTVVVVPIHEPDVARANLKLGERAIREGKNVKYHYVDQYGPARGTQYTFVLDLRDLTWGTEPRRELDGRTAAEVRRDFRDAVGESQDRGPIGMRFGGNVVVLGGVVMFVEQEPQPDRFAVRALSLLPPLP